MNSALWEALLTERVRDQQARACWSRLARQARRTKHRASSDQIRAEGQPSCLQAVGLRGA